MITFYPNSWTKRFFDILLSFGAALITSPIWFASIVLILISDPGPVLFRQERIGTNGKPFPIFKFRTMYVAKTNSSTVTTSDDKRVFAGGDFLRRFKIDELPQLLNVLNGSMSLVGPRPTVQEDYERMSPEQKRRFEVPPGITGLAQISGNTELPWGKRIQYDLEYMKNATLWMDIKILFRTAKLVITGRAETHPKSEDEWEE